MINKLLINFCHLKRLDVVFNQGLIQPYCASSKEIDTSQLSPLSLWGSITNGFVFVIMNTKGTHFLPVLLVPLEIKKTLRSLLINMTILSCQLLIGLFPSHFAFDFKFKEGFQSHEHYFACRLPPIFMEILLRIQRQALLEALVSCREV